MTIHPATTTLGFAQVQRDLTTVTQFFKRESDSRASRNCKVVLVLVLLLLLGFPGLLTDL